MKLHIGLATVLISMICSLAAGQDIGEEACEETVLVQHSKAVQKMIATAPLCSEAQISSAISEMTAACQEAMAAALKDGSDGSCRCYQEVSLQTALDLKCYATERAREASAGSPNSTLYNQYLGCYNIAPGTHVSLTRLGSYDYQYSSRYSACMSVHARLQGESNNWYAPLPVTYSYPCSSASAKMMPLVAGTYTCLHGYMWYVGIPPPDLEGAEVCDSKFSLYHGFDTAEDACMFEFDMMAVKRTAMDQSFCTWQGVDFGKGYTIQTYAQPQMPGHNVSGYAPGYPNTIVGGFAVGGDNNITSLVCNLSPGSPPSIDYSDCQ